MKHYSKTLTLIWSLTALPFIACSSPIEDNKAGNDTKNDQRIENELYGMLEECATIKTIQKWSDKELSEGVTYVKAQTVKDSDRPATIYLVKMAPDAPGAALKTGLDVPEAGDVFPYEMKYPSEIAEMFDTSEEKVVAMIGGDFSRWLDYQLADPQPIDFGNRGPVHHRGQVLQDHFVPEEHWVHQALSFIGIDKDGKGVIGDAADYPGAKDRLQECTGGGYRTLRDGKVCKGFDIKDDGNYVPLEDNYPFSSIGFREDGTVIMMIVDGRSEISKGLTYSEAGSLMLAMGCTNALMLDGGGSAQMLLKNEESGKFTLQNKATDGSERKMRTYWMITVTK